MERPARIIVLDDEVELRNMLQRFLRGHGFDVRVAEDSKRLDRYLDSTLGAEGVGKDVTMIIGNGYAPGHAELTLELLRSEPRLRALFEQRYV